MASSITDIETYQKADELMDIFRAAVSDAQAESREMGVANVYYQNGKRYFELPSGEIRQVPLGDANPPRVE